MAQIHANIQSIAIGFGFFGSFNAVQEKPVIECRQNQLVPNLVKFIACIWMALFTNLKEVAWQRFD